jgi:3-hydroxybutyrate dehydrogenase
MAFQVDGKTALVTGAGSGIGLEFTKLLLANNCNVVVADLGLRPEAEEVVNGKQPKGKAIFQKADVTDWAQLQAAFDVALKQFGSLDIVCPGAGLYEPVCRDLLLSPEMLRFTSQAVFESEHDRLTPLLGMVHLLEIHR